MLDELAVGLAHEHGGDQHIRVPACKRNWMVKVLELGPLSVIPVTITYRIISLWSDPQENIVNPETPLEAKIVELKNS